jgi:enoyl-CoA hydratase/carnithine racemase
MSDFIETSVTDGVLTLRMNRPEKKNAIDRPMYAAMAAALQRADADDAIAATLITGVPGAFSAGNDIADFVAFALRGGKTGEVEGFLRALVASEKPIVAAVDGLAIGIGTTLLMHCDLVFASDRSTFRTPFLDLGLVPEAGSSLIAPQLMGHQRAFALLAMGAKFDAEEARAANLVYRVTSSETVEGEAMAAAVALAAKPKQALRIARDLIRGPKEVLLARIEEEIRHFEERLSSAEARAAFQAFMTR